MSNLFQQSHDGTALEPRGRAALLLVESLMHTLIARSVISVAEAVETVDVAIEAERERHDEIVDEPDMMSPTNVLLLAIRESMAIDL